MRFSFPLFLLPFVCLSLQPLQGQAEPQAVLKNGTAKKKQVAEGEAPTVITADSVTAQGSQVFEAIGDAELRKDDQLIRADRLKFLQETNELFADGNVRVENSDTSMAGPSLKMNMDSKTGEMRQPAFSMNDSTFRGTSELMSIEGKQRYNFEHGSFTSCPAGNNDWLLKFSELDLDRNTQTGHAYNARIEFMGVPTPLYTPWMSFPLDNRRQSGLLAPTYRYTNIAGNEITVPFYWNIGSNYDATILYRDIAKRGTLYDSEFRYMGSSYRGQLEYGELSQDKLAQLNRSHASLVHQQSFGGGFSGTLNFNQASDNAYYRDLALTPAIALQRILPREAALFYTGGWLTASVRGQNFQTFQDPASLIEIPYARLPQVSLGAQQVFAGAALSMNAEYVDFKHPTLVNGKRTVFTPSITYPLVKDPAYYITPKLTVHNTQYDIASSQTAIGSAYSRSIPISSLDSGMTLERDFTFSEHEFVQTLEPRIFYVNIPYVNQDKLPIFDTTAAPFNFAQMYIENQFVGSDRISDANQVTTSLTSRLLDGETGNEYLRGAVGQRFSSQAQRVTLGGPAETTNQSDVLIGVTGRVSTTLILDSLGQYNPSNSRFENFFMTSRYRPEAGKVFNLGYRYSFNPVQTNTLKQLDMSTQWLLGGHWHMVAQVQYSLQANRMVQVLGGLEYLKDCWSIRFGVQQFATALNVTTDVVFFQLELSELIRIDNGIDPLAALRLSVPGYTKMSGRESAKPARSSP